MSRSSSSAGSKGPHANVIDLNEDADAENIGPTNELCTDVEVSRPPADEVHEWVVLLTQEHTGPQPAGAIAAAA